MSGDTEGDGDGGRDGMNPAAGDTERLLDRFVRSFGRAIADEMAAMRERLGPFEVPLAGGTLLDRGDDGSARYRYRALGPSDKLLPGIECSLRAGGAETLVSVEGLQGDAVILRAARTLAATGGEGTLVVYPWFLYEKLRAALEGLSVDRFEVHRALALFGKGEPRTVAREPVCDHGALNDSQQWAVKLCGDSELAFVWGPPGTGKTRTLAHVVEELAARRERLLLLSTTNAAVDQALAQMARRPALAQAIEAGEVVRLGRTEGDTHGAGLSEVVRRLGAAHVAALERLRARHREAKAGAARLSRLCEELRGAEPAAQQSLFAEPERSPLTPGSLSGLASPGLSRRWCALPVRAQRQRLERRAARLERVRRLCRDAIDTRQQALAEREGAIVRGARVVLATLTAAHFSPLLAGERFDTLVVEEASMAVLPSLFYAACLARTRTLMVGDPRQLPPIVQASSHAVRQAMGRSIFQVTVPDPDRSPLVAMLDTQYRMHPTIGELVSRLYYGGRLRHGAGTEERAAIAARAPYPGEALVVIDTAGRTRCQSREGGSRINPDSAALCIELATDAVRAGAESVAVITPYADQARQLRQLTRALGERERIECSTVHRFQGHERDLVILDTVDAAPLAPGVLLAREGAGSAAENLLNVSLSRARGKLLLVADVAYFRVRARDTPVGRTLAQALACGRRVQVPDPPNARS